MLCGNLVHESERTTHVCPDDTLGMAEGKQDDMKLSDKNQTLQFYEALTDGMVPKTSPGPRFEWIGHNAYMRGVRGVFKLERYSGGTHDAFVGLAGTYTSDAGKKDHIVFRFGDYLSPDLTRTTNPTLAKERGCSAWKSGSTEHHYDWYAAPPITLKNLHAAITAWVKIWNLS